MDDTRSSVIFTIRYGSFVLDNAPTWSLALNGKSSRIE
jgi:hypothetical protein